MVSANQYGFLPGNDAFQNAQALQAAVDCGGPVLVEAPGIYDLSETIEIGDNTELRFSAGVQIRRQPSQTGRNGNAFLNKGALSHTYNSNISLIGLHLDCNGVESADLDTDSRYVGLRAQVGMIYVKDLIIEVLNVWGFSPRITPFKSPHSSGSGWKTCIFPATKTASISVGAKIL